MNQKKTKSGPRVLVVDDEKAIRDALRLTLEYEGYRMIEAASGAEALERVEPERAEIMLLDIKMPRMDGLEVLDRVRERWPELPVIMISGHGTIATAVEALQKGAQDFMEKPLEREVVLHRIRAALEQRRLREDLADLRQESEERWRIVGSSPALEEMRAAVARAAPTNATVLVTGESGTGKELVARAVHAASRRAERSFVKVNCAAIPDELIESELFGHEKGSFTGATRDQTGKFVQADGGTLFLDEVGDMSLKTQSKVLRALQDGEVEPVGYAGSINVDVRVVAATNKDLGEEIAAGRFREDLFFRLNVIPIHLPPLRERREDIPALVRHFAETYCRENNYRPKAFSPAALEELQRRPWRGNIRELKNQVERVLIMVPGSEITPGDLPAGLPPSDGAAAGTSGAATLREFKEASEKAFLEAKLREHDWNVTATARAIDTPRSNLYKKLEHYGLTRRGKGQGGEDR
jgi:two-component system nitrogen regulation response regulator NtrX